MNRKTLVPLATYIAALVLGGGFIAQAPNAVLQHAAFDLTLPWTRGWLMVVPITAILWLVADGLADRAFRDRPEHTVLAPSELHRASAMVAGILLTAAGTLSFASAGSALMLSAQTRDALLGPVVLDAHDKTLVRSILVEGAAVTAGAQLILGLSLLLAPERFAVAIEWARREWRRLGRPKLEPDQAAQQGDEADKAR
jgi:Kef-type K+ transport system membrane component KefB